MKKIRIFNKAETTILLKNFLNPFIDITSIRGRLETIGKTK